MKRRLKQLAYLLLFLTFWGGVAGLTYLTFFRQAPSCFDGKQNQGEEDVDCGGPCKTICIARDRIQPSALGEPQVFRASDALISVLVELKNPNPTTALRQIPYVITVTGESGVPLQLRGVASLYASEVRRFVLVRPGGDLRGSLDASIEVTTSSAQWTPAETFKKPELSIVNAVTAEEPARTRVEGTVSSDDPLGVTDVTVVALFYDTTGSLIGAAQTVIDRLAPGASTRFAISYPPLLDLDPEATQVSVSAYRP